MLTVRPAATLALGALLLAACEEMSVVPAVPEAVLFVPIETVLRETAGRPYECLDPDAAGTSCVAIAQMRRSGTTLRNIATTLVEVDPEVRINTVDRLRIVDGRVCGDPADSRIDVAGDLPPDDLAFIRDFVGAAAESLGEVCGSYYRDGDGYIFVTTDTSGAARPEVPPVRSVFLATAPALRFVSPF